MRLVSALPRPVSASGWPVSARSEDWLLSEQPNRLNAPLSRPGYILHLLAQSQPRPKSEDGSLPSSCRTHPAIAWQVLWRHYKRDRRRSCCRLLGSCSHAGLKNLRKASSRVAPLLRSSRKAASAWALAHVGLKLSGSSLREADCRCSKCLQARKCSSCL